MLDALNGCFQVRCNLVHAHCQDDLFRPEGHRCNPVAHTI